MTDPAKTLSPDLTEEFRRRLREAREVLFQTLAGTDEELATLEGHQAGALAEDVASAEAAVLLSRLEGRQKHELDEINDALARLEAGRFGQCERCGRSIALPRLRAMPAARHCVDCQKREET